LPASGRHSDKPPTARSSDRRDRARGLEVKGARRGGRLSRGSGARAGREGAGAAPPPAAGGGLGHEPGVSALLAYLVGADEERTLLDSRRAAPRWWRRSIRDSADPVSSSGSCHPSCSPPWEQPLNRMCLRLLLLLLVPGVLDAAAPEPSPSRKASHTTPRAAAPAARKPAFDGGDAARRRDAAFRGQKSTSSSPPRLWPDCARNGQDTGICQATRARRSARQRRRTCATGRGI